MKERGRAAYRGRAPKMKENNGLESILKDYCEWLNKVSKYPPVDYYDCDLYKVLDSYYKTAMEMINKLDYTKQSINEFCGLLSGDSKGIAGLYISALINSTLKEGEMTVIRPGIVLNCLGYRHSRGTLIIEGHVGDFTGTLMSGGQLIAKNKAGRYTCSGMRGGKLAVNGEIRSIAFDARGGEVWEGNRQIYPPKPLLRGALKRLVWGVRVAIRERKD